MEGQKLEVVAAVAVAVAVAVAGSSSSSSSSSSSNINTEESERDVIEGMMSILIEKSHLRERLIVQAAQMFVKMKNRHDENDTGLLDEERFAGRG